MVGAIQQASFYKDWISLSAKLGLRKGFGSSISNEHMRPLSGFGADSASIDDFLILGAYVNALRSVNGSIRCVSSGINSYAPPPPY